MAFIKKTMRYIFRTALIFAISSSLGGCDDRAGIAKLEQPPADTLTDVDRSKHDGNKGVVVVGEGDGEVLRIDGRQKEYSCDKTIQITAGSYSSIYIENLNGEAGCPFVIENAGTVKLEGDGSSIFIADVSHLVITGDGVPSLSHGFVFRNNKRRAIEMFDDVNYITIQHMQFENVRDYVIFYDNNRVYDKREQSFMRGHRYLHLKVNECGPLITYRGGIAESSIKGMIDQLEIAHCEVTRSSNIANIPCVRNYEIHHNSIDRVNEGAEGHNGIFHLTGTGKFYNNFISNHQGNAIRAWAVTLGTEPQEILIYNNIVVNSEMYSAFEIQSFKPHMIAGQTSHANAMVFNNTCGNLNLSKNWYGVVLDAYRMFGGKCEVFNNLAFNFPEPHPQSFIVSYMSIDRNVLTESSNLYFPTAKDAGIVDEVEFRLKNSSKAKNAGVDYLTTTTDFHGNPRNPKHPSIGAVE